MNVKRLLSVLIVIALLFLAACAGQAEAPVVPQETAEPGEAVTFPAEIDDGRLRVITTIFPQYDFIRQIAGDRVNLTMLLSPGAEAHAFEPTPQDIIQLQNADLFVYVGGHGDEWVETILGAVLEEHDMYVVALAELVWLLPEAHEHSHAHGYDHDYDHSTPPVYDHDHGYAQDDAYNHDSDYDHSHTQDEAYSHDHDYDDGPGSVYDYDHPEHDHAHYHEHEVLGFDEHVWTSPYNAIRIVEALTEILAELDAENADYYRENAAAYLTQLRNLDQAFTDVVTQAVRHTIVFGDRNPFRYFAHYYGLAYHAAFIGCSSETQASPATIAQLIGLVQMEQIPVVFYIEFSNRQIANVIAEDTGARLLEFHSAHNLSQADFDAGVTFLDLMWRNVEHLREALH